MMIVRITSGFGNQMFQYNFLRFLKEHYKNTEVKADLTWFYANDDHHGYELEKVFKHDGSDFAIEEATPFEIFKVTGLLPNISKNHGRSFEKFRRYPNRILREINRKKCRENIIDRMDTEIDLDTITKLDAEKDWYFIGFWIEERFWKNRIDNLQKELRFDSKFSKENADIIDKINNPGSLDSNQAVSIHVRRGDYLTSYAGLFKPLGRTYYEAAVKEIEKVCKMPHFYIFSDDSEWVTEEFSWLNNKTVVDINHGSDSFRDMQLMSLCKHNIIANSTFSTWAAILNSNRGHLTVYPADYLLDEDSEIKSIDGWVRI